MLQLDAYQQAAVDSNDPHICCLAGAGSGKTAVMIHRIARIAKETNKPHHILALTFTNAAALEMKERYCKLVANLDDNIPEFRTFHAFCYSLIVNNPSICWKLGYSDVPAIADPAEIKTIEVKARAQCRLKSIKHLNPYQQKIFDKCVDRLLKQQNIISFDRLITRIVDMFLQDDPCILRYKDQYKYIFVDEFQDTDIMQWKFIQSFKTANIFVCGDALQNIYSFRGTTNEIIKQLSNDSSWTTVKLLNNYRSDRSIVKLANKYSSSYASDSYRIDMNNVSKHAGQCSIDKYPSIPYQEPVNIRGIDILTSRLQSDCGTHAILCRTNAEVTEMHNLLHKYHINPILRSRSTDIDSDRYAKDENYRADWIASYLNSDQYNLYIYKCLASPETSKLEILIQYFKDDANKIEAELLNSNPGIFGSDVYLGTIHSVKGLEFDNVHVINANQWSFLLNSEDAKNLFYVAITRAKHNLYIYTGLEGIWNK